MHLSEPLFWILGLLSTSVGFLYAGEIHHVRLRLGKRYEFLLPSQRSATVNKRWEQEGYFGKDMLLKLCMSLGLTMETTGEKIRQVWAQDSSTAPDRSSFLPNFNLTSASFSVQQSRLSQSLTRVGTRHSMYFPFHNISFTNSSYSYQHHLIININYCVNNNIG